MWLQSDEIAPNYDGGLMRAKWNKGGFRTVKTVTEMLNIPFLYRWMDASETTVVYVQADKSLYELTNNPPSNTTVLADWNQVILGGVSSGLAPVGDWDPNTNLPSLTDASAVGNNGDFYFIINTPAPIPFTFPDLFQGQEVTLKNGDYIVSVGNYFIAVASGVSWDTLAKPVVIDEYVAGIVIPHLHTVSDISDFASAVAGFYDIDDTADHTIAYEDVPVNKIVEVEFLNQWFYKKSDLYTNLEVDALLTDYQIISEKGMPNGYVPLDASGLIPSEYITASRQILVVPEATIAAFAAVSGSYSFGNGADIVLAGATPDEVYLYVGGTKTDVANYIPYASSSGPTITASNGLNKVGSDIQLGGPLTSHITLSGAFDIGFTNNRIGIGVAPGSITSLTRLDVYGIIGGNALRVADDTNTTELFKITNAGVATFLATLNAPTNSVIGIATFASASLQVGSITGNPQIRTDTNSFTFTGDTGSYLKRIGASNIALGVSGVNLITLATGGTTFNQGIATVGTPSLVSFVGAAHTTLAASTEATDVNFNLARTVQFNTGALTTQRAFVIQAPTYDFVAASTITNAVTVNISGAPAPGANATLTRRAGLLIGTSVIPGTSLGTMLGVKGATDTNVATFEANASATGFVVSNAGDLAAYGSSARSVTSGLTGGFILSGPTVYAIKHNGVSGIQYTAQASYTDGHIFSNFTVQSDATAEVKLMQITPTFSPSSGTNRYTNLLIRPTYNFTGGTRIIYGIDYAPILTDVTGVTHIAWRNTSGSVIIGNLSQTGSAGRLEVFGHSTGSTFAARIMNSAGERIIDFRDDGLMTLGSLSSAFRMGTTASGISFSQSGTNLYLIGQGVATTLVPRISLGETSDITLTSGSYILLGTVPQSNIFAPTSGNASYTQFRIRPRYNTTGTYSGIVYGIDYDPELLSATGLTNIAWRNVTGQVLINGTTVTANTVLDVRGNSGGNVFRLASDSNANILIITNSGSTTFYNTAFVQGSNNGFTATGQITTNNSYSFIHTGGLNGSTGQYGSFATIGSTTSTGGIVTSFLSAKGFASAVDHIGFDHNPTTPNNISGTHLAFRNVSGQLLFGGTTITTGSILADFQSSTQGIVVPRPTVIANITSPVNGMVAYDATTNLFNFRQAGAWVTLSGGGGGGNVTKVGTPVDNQIGVWTGDGTIEGTAGLTYTGTTLTVSGGTIIGAATQNLFATVTTDLTFGTNINNFNLGGTGSATMIANFFQNPTTSGQFKTIRIGNGGSGGSNTSLDIGGSTGNLVVNIGRSTNTRNRVGIGRDPIGSDATYNSLEIGTGLSLTGNKSGDDGFISTNSFYDGTWKHSTGVGVSNRMSLLTTGIVFATAPAVTINTALTYTDFLSLSSGTIIGIASQNLFNTVSTTINAFGAATTLTIGATTGTMNLRNATITLTQTPADDVGFATSNILVRDASGNLDKLVASGGGTTNFLRADGTWAAPGGGSGWAVNGTTTLTGAVNIITSATNTNKFRADALGATQANGAGLWLANNTAAGAGAQQWSPSLTLEGQGWKTAATAASQPVRYSMWVVPIEGGSAPSGQLDFASSIDGGAYSRSFSLRSTQMELSPDGSSPMYFGSGISGYIQLGAGGGAITGSIIGFSNYHTNTNVTFRTTARSGTDISYSTIITTGNTVDGASGTVYLGSGVPSGSGVKGNVALGTIDTATNFQSMSNGLFIKAAITNPTGNPTAGAFFYADAADSYKPKWRVPGGTTYDLTTGAGGSGDVVGPASATDNAIARFDLTTGKLIQDSVVTITDLGDIALGNVSTTGNRTISVLSSTSNASLLLVAQNAGAVGLYGNGGIVLDGGSFTQGIRFRQVSGKDIIETDGNISVLQIQTTEWGAASNSSSDLILRTGNSGTLAATNTGHVFLSSGLSNGAGLDGNIGLHTVAVANWQAMEKGLYIANAVANPTGNPTGGVFLYNDANDIKVRRTDGDIVNLTRVNSGWTTFTNAPSALKTLNASSYTMDELMRIVYTLTEELRTRGFIKA